MAQPRLPDKQTKDAMLPGRCYESSPFKESIRKILRVNDEQLAVNRYRWYNLPPELSGNLIERILYYRGQAMLFYIPEMEKFYFSDFLLEKILHCLERNCLFCLLGRRGRPQEQGQS